MLVSTVIVPYYYGTFHPMETRTPSRDWTLPDDADHLSPSQAFDILADECRRQTLAELADATLPLDEQALAAAVAARTRRGSRGEPTGKRARSVAVELQHVHLPKLQASRLVERDSDAGRIESVSIDAADGLVADVLDRQDAVDPATIDRLCEVLSTPRHRQVLATLRAAAAPLTLDDLTRALAHRDPATVTQVDVDRLRTRLHHVTLPKLQNAGLIETTSSDAETGYVYSGHPFIQADWL
jgi:hypothetical protein